MIDVTLSLPDRLVADVALMMEADKEAGCRCNTVGQHMAKYIIKTMMIRRVNTLLESYFTKMRVKSILSAGGQNLYAQKLDEMANSFIRDMEREYEVDRLTLDSPDSDCRL